MKVKLYLSPNKLLFYWKEEKKKKKKRKDCWNTLQILTNYLGSAVKI